MSRTGFLLAEDEAIKLRFSGLTVTDDRNSERPVKVFFRYPEAETEREYPFITIDLLDVIEARNRQHSEMRLYSNLPAEHPAALTYWPDTASASSPVLNGFDHYQTTEFIAVDILYQVATHTRTALHDRQLTARILSTVTPFRYGSIIVGADGTSRRLDLVDWATADLLDAETAYRKRIFRKIYTLQMSAELPTSALTGLKKVLTVSTTLERTN